MSEFIPPPEEELAEGEKILDPVLTPEEKARAHRAQIILLVVMWICIILPFVILFWLLSK